MFAYNKKGSGQKVKNESFPCCESWRQRYLHETKAAL